tara:strand:+ start:235 stop:1428 length:1194 start_codon:yes stop_codon:yes gene_type:complete
MDWSNPPRRHSPGDPEYKFMFKELAIVPPRRWTIRDVANHDGGVEVDQDGIMRNHIVYGSRPLTCAWGCRVQLDEVLRAEDEHWTGPTRRQMWELDLLYKYYRPYLSAAAKVTQENPGFADLDVAMGSVAGSGRLANRIFNFACDEGRYDAEGHDKDGNALSGSASDEEFGEVQVMGYMGGRRSRERGRGEDGRRYKDTTSVYLDPQHDGSSCGPVALMACRKCKKGLPVAYFAPDPKTSLKKFKEFAQLVEDIESLDFETSICAQDALAGTNTRRPKRASLEESGDGVTALSALSMDKLPALPRAPPGGKLRAASCRTCRQNMKNYKEQAKDLQAVLERGLDNPKPTFGPMTEQEFDQAEAVKRWDAMIDNPARMKLGLVDLLKVPDLFPDVTLGV